MKMTPQNLHRKITRNTLKKEELYKIGKILGGKYISCFSFPGGVIIGDKVMSGKSTDKFVYKKITDTNVNKD